jgi:hypothetical protein
VFARAPTGVVPDVQGRLWKGLLRRQEEKEWLIKKKKCHKSECRNVSRTTKNKKSKTKRLQQSAVCLSQFISEVLNGKATVSHGGGLSFAGMLLLNQI